MSRPCPRRRSFLRRNEWLAIGRTLGASQWVAAPAHAEEAPFRWRAPIELRRPAAFVQLALPVGAYGHSLQRGLQDLRIVDARGERVPFALLMPRIPEPETFEQQRDAVLYALPAR